jgi:hypothetical protein
MRRHLPASLLLAFVLLSIEADLSACGDKFLVLGRGSRFQHAALARFAAAILVYANPGSTLPQALANLPVEATLRKAGYRPTTVASAQDFEDALHTRKWDLLLVDVSDTEAVTARVAGESSSPAILPVLYNPTGNELAAARKQYRCVLKSPTKNESFLETIDEALALRGRPSERVKPGR